MYTCLWCMHECVEVRRQHRVFPCYSVCQNLGHNLSPNLELAFPARLADQRLEGPTCFHPINIEITSMFLCLDFYVGSGDPTSGFNVSMASVLSIRLLHEPLIFFNKISHQYVIGEQFTAVTSLFWCQPEASSPRFICILYRSSPHPSPAATFYLTILFYLFSFQHGYLSHIKLYIHQSIFIDLSHQCVRM